MKILKEAKDVLNLKLNDYKKFYGTLTRLTESEFKKLVSLKSNNDRSNEIKDVLNSLSFSLNFSLSSNTQSSSVY